MRQIFAFSLEATQIGGVIYFGEKYGLAARGCNNNNEQYVLMLLKLLPEVLEDREQLASQ